MLQPGQPTYSTHSIENKGDDQPLRFIITAVDESVSGIRIELNGAKTLEFPITLEKGQTLKYTEGSEAVLYDNHWQIVRKIPVNTSLLHCTAGKQQVLVDARFEGTNEAPKLKLEFLFFGPAEKLENKSVMKAYIAIPYQGRNEIREELDTITSILNQCGVSPLIFADQNSFKAEEEQQMMQQAMEDINESDWLIALGLKSHRHRHRSRLR